MARQSAVKALQPAVAALAGFYLSMLGTLVLWAVVPLAFGWQVTVAMSGSMEPAIKTGDILVAEPAGPDALKPGMVPLAVNPMQRSTLYTHRIVNILSDGRLVTKGDNNGSLDPEPLKPSEVRGVERLRVPMIGIPLQTIRSGNPLPMVLFVLATAAAASVVLNDKKQTAAGRPRTPKAPRGRRRATGTPITVYATRREARRARQRERAALARTAGRITTVVALAAALVVGSSAAMFNATTTPPRSSWTASASFAGPASNVATCNGATYTVSVTTATITCTIVSPGTGSVTHDLTIQGTGANTKWTVTADWSGVTKFKNATLTNYGYPAVSNIPGPTYVVSPQNLCTGSPQPDVPTSTCNFTWIGSTLPARTPRLILYLNP